MGFLGTTVLLGLLLNILATWLTSSQGIIPKDSPLGWLITHWLIMVLMSCLLLLFAALTWFLSREHALRPRRTSILSGKSRLYRTYFRYEHSDLDMKGISTRGTYALDLEQVFVELRINPTPAHQASADPIRLPPELRTGTHDIWNYLAHLDQHLVILGAPGSGKTTLLKHIGLSLVHHRHRAHGMRLRWTVPLFLPLREYSSFLKDHPGYSLIDAAVHQISKWKQPILPEWIERQLQMGRCFVLLDGLDEIADPSQRQHMVEWVQNQMVAYGANRFVITSRPLGYRSNPLDHVAVLDVQSFTLEQITRFLRVWYRANEIKRAARDDPGVLMKAEEGAEDLLMRLRTTPALFALAVNPLLLTMIATVHLYYGTLPRARITLYKAICEVFLNRRAEVPDSPQELRADKRQLVLQPLAYTLMQQGKREITRKDACQILTMPLQLVDTTITPEIFLDHLEAISSGLLLEREQGIYGFAHQTFQEYLAMAHMQEQHLEHELVTHIEESWWHETLRLYCAQADATPILEACLSLPILSLETLTLAIDCAGEARTAQQEVKERLYAFLEQGVNDADPEKQRVIAQALFKRRLRHMRPLQETTFVDTTLITCAEYQLFLSEQHASDYNAAPDTWKEPFFPQGQGQYPLLGIRLEDAKAFCRWLTEREGQRYRLPRQEECQQIKAVIGAELMQDTSYWEEEGTIVWAHHSPSTSLRAHVVTVLARTLDLSSAYIHDHDLDLGSAYIRARDLDLGSARALVLARDLGRARDLLRDLARDLDLNRSLALVRKLGSAIILARELGITSRLFVLARERAFDVSFLLFLSGQRPKGMLPVYEGILLVKEQVTESPAVPHH